MIKILTNTFVGMIEIYALYLICKKNGIKRNHSVLISSIITIIYISFAILATIHFETSIIMLIGNLLLQLLFSYAYKIKFAKRIMILILFYGFSMAAELIALSVITTIVDVSIIEVQQNNALYFISFIISKFLLYLVIRIWCGLSKDKQNLPNMKFLLLNSIMPIISLIIMFILAEIIVDSNESIEKALLLIVSALLVVLNIITYIVNEWTADSHTKTQKYEREMLMLKNQKEEYGIIIENQLRSNKEMHDMKHKIFSLKNFIDTDPKKASELIGGLYDSFVSKQITEYTKIKDIDALLNAKEQYARDRNIKIEYIVLLDGEISIESMDICVILGNVIDNAIENFVSKESDAKIVLCIKAERNYLAINCQNPTDVECAEVNRTSKANKDNTHGYGLAKIQDVANLHDGAMCFDIEEGIFSINVMLKLCRSRI